MIRPEIGDTMYGVAGASGGSTTAAGVSPAVRIATFNALEALKAKVAPALGVEATTLVASNGRIQVKDNASKGLSWADACKQIGPQPISVEFEVPELHQGPGCVLWGRSRPDSHPHRDDRLPASPEELARVGDSRQRGEV